MSEKFLSPQRVVVGAGVPAPRPPQADRSKRLRVRGAAMPHEGRF